MSGTVQPVGIQRSASVIHPFFGRKQNNPAFLRDVDHFKRRALCTDDTKFSLEACRCIGACGLAPVMMINEDVYGRLTPDMVPGILQKYE